MSLIALASHLDAQLQSAERMLGIIERQERAIADRDPAQIMACAADLNGELARRQGLEADRARLLADAGRRLGVQPEQVTLDAIVAGAPADDADAIRQRSHDLGAKLVELERRYEANRTLVRQELAFVDQMIDALGAGTDAGGYTPFPSRDDQKAPSRLLDVQG